MIASAASALVQEQVQIERPAPVDSVGESQLQLHRTRSSTGRRKPPFTHRRRLSSSPSRSLRPSSLGALDSSTASSAPILALLRVLVLSHLAEMEQQLISSHLPLSPASPSSPSPSPSPSASASASDSDELDSPSPDSMCGKGSDGEEEPSLVMDEALLSWAHDTLDMLHRIRSDVSSHLPDLAFDAHTLEELLRTYLYDLSYQSLLDEFRVHLPDAPHMPQMPEFTLSDVQTRLHDVHAHLREMSSSLDLSQPLNYLPVLSAHLDALHARLSSVSTGPNYGCTLPSLLTTSTLSELLDRVLSSDVVPAVLHRVDGHNSPLEKAAKDMSETLKKSLDGAKLVVYEDLPREWRNNPWVSSGYRFIPLHNWPIIILSLFALHNETLNIYTHMLPLLHNMIRIIPSLSYASVPLDRPERVYTTFAMSCLLGSVIWHTMTGCAHRSGMELCAKVDYFGIGWLISASVGTVVYYGLSCHPQAVLVYLSLCAITGIAGSIFPFMSWFNDRRYRPYRVAFFVGMCFTALAPLAHLAYLYNPSKTLTFFSPIGPSILSYVIGLVFYATHIPERFVVSHHNEKGIMHMARWTDWIGGGSHAIWHAFIVLAIYQHKWGMSKLRSGVGGESCLVY